MWIQKEIRLKPKTRGFHLITDELLRELRCRRSGGLSRHDPAFAAQQKMVQRDVIKRLVDMQYDKFRVRGDVIDILPAESSEHALRLTLFDDEVETLSLFDPLTGHIRKCRATPSIRPAITSRRATRCWPRWKRSRSSWPSASLSIGFVGWARCCAHADYKHMGLASPRASKITLL